MTSVFEVNADNWEKEVLQSDILVVVDFWHEGCPWCLRLAPVFSEVAEECKGKARFASLNVMATHENQLIAQKYGVMGVPTLGFFCDGRPVETIVGFHTKDHIKQIVNDVVAKHRECVEKSTKLKIS